MKQYISQSLRKFSWDISGKREKKPIRNNEDLLKYLHPLKRIEENKLYSLKHTYCNDIDGT